MKKNKNGFTLIELLAVIVVLAIIALIATPMVLNTIEQARKGAASSSAYSYVNGVETKLVTYMLKNGGANYEPGEHTLSELQNDLKVEVKGETPSEGSFCIGENGIITKASIKINGYVVSYDGKETKTTNLDEIEDITCGGIKYYAFGMPTTSSSTDFQSVVESSRSKTFIQLDGEQLSLCIYSNNTLECFKNNNYGNERNHLLGLSPLGCGYNAEGINCGPDGFNCVLDINGYVSCVDKVSNLRCALNSDNSVDCH